MKVELLVARCGPAGAQNVGDVVEVSEDEAKRLFAAQYAKPLRATVPETATSKRVSEKAKR